MGDRHEIVAAYGLAPSAILTSFRWQGARHDDFQELRQVMFISVRCEIKVAWHSNQTLVADLLFVGLCEAVVITPRDARGAHGSLLVAGGEEPYRIR